MMQIVKHNFLARYNMQNINEYKFQDLQSYAAIDQKTSRYDAK